MTDYTISCKLPTKRFMPVTVAGSWRWDGIWKKSHLMTQKLSGPGSR